MTSHCSELHGRAKAKAMATELDFNGCDGVRSQSFHSVLGFFSMLMMLLRNCDLYIEDYLTGQVHLNLVVDVLEKGLSDSPACLNLEADEDYEDDDFNVQLRAVPMSTSASLDAAQNAARDAKARSATALINSTKAVVNALPRVLNLETMQQEVMDIKDDRAARHVSKRTAPFNETVAGIANIRKMESEEEHKLVAVADALASDQWTETTAVNAMGHVTRVVTALPKMTSALLSLPLIQRVLQKEIARAHIWALHIRVCAHSISVTIPTSTATRPSGR